MSIFKFASLAHPEKYGYALDTSAWGSSSETHSYYRQFETYGDGLIQHSGDWSVTFDFLTDYLASLAVAMMANDELVEAADYSFRRGASAELIAFAAGVVWRESDKQYDKRRYFSTQLSKMGARAKQYDKRFAEIQDWHDGSRSSIFRLICPEYPTRFEQYQIALSVENWAELQAKYIPTGERFPVFFDGDYQKLYSLKCVLQCCRHIAEAHERKQWAQGSIDNYKAGLERAALRLLAEATATGPADSEAAS